MKVRIQIETETFIRFWLVIIGFLLVALMVYSARTGLILVGSALFLALALNGPVTKIARVLPGKSRVASTAIAFLLVVAVIGSFLVMAAPPIVQQTAKFVQTVPELFESTTANWQTLNRVIEDNNLRPQVDEALNSVKKNAATWATNMTSNVIAGVGSIFSFIVSLMLVLVLAFLMLVEGPAWMTKIWGLYTHKERMELHRKTVTRMAHIVSGFVTGQLTVSAIGALASGLALFIISLIFREVPSNLAIPTAALTFIFSLIPMFGSTISAVLVGVLVGLNSIIAAVVYLIFFIIYQQIENNFVGPAIQSKRLELSALIVLIAVTIGVYVFGVVGAIISIPIAGCIKVLFEEHLAHAKRQRHLKTDAIEA